MSDLVKRYEEEHQLLNFAIPEAVQQFRSATGGKVLRVDIRSTTDVITTFTPPADPKASFAREILRRIDFLDAEIDAVENRLAECDPNRLELAKNHISRSPESR